MTKDNIALAALLWTKEACWEGGVPLDHKVLGYFALSDHDNAFQILVKAPCSFCKHKADSYLFCSGCGAANLGVLCSPLLEP